MKRIPSFTMPEMMITLLISSIVLSIVYYAWGLFHHQFTRYHARSNAGNEFRLLRKAMQRDMDEADAIIAADDGKLLLEMRDEGSAVEYYFTGNAIARVSGGTVDSFRVNNRGYQATPFNDELPLIEQLVISVRTANVFFNTYFSKQYSAAQLMREEEHERTDRYP